PEVALDGGEHLPVVVHGQDHGLGHDWRSGDCPRGDVIRGLSPDFETGNVTQNSVPLVLVCKSIVPWWRWMMRRAMSRPRPVPCPTSFVAKNGSKMRFLIPSGIPGPSSVTRTTTWPASWEASTRTWPPGVASIALSSRFAHTWFSSPP